MNQVLIISPEYMGYITKIATNLRNNKNAIVTDIAIPAYKYPSVASRVLNFFFKCFSKDLKYTYREKYIHQIIKNQTYDCILIIRPDLLAIENLKSLKSKTKLFKTYLFDGIDRFPRQLKTTAFFDEVYSYEPNDCKKYDFIPITNFIYKELPFENRSTPFKYSVFNITSYDKNRFALLLKIAAILEKQKLAYKIIVKTNKKIASNNGVELIQNSIPLDKVNLYLQESSCMLDLAVINKHKGLTFRIFEAIGAHKKIITNNKEIENYDFYNPNNILIINEKNIEIPMAFLASRYEPVPEKIYEKYTLDSWIKTVFKEIID